MSMARAWVGAVAGMGVVLVVGLPVVAPPARGQVANLAAQATLTITVPTGPVDIGSGAAGTQITGQLGTVRVTDNRLIALTWTATVSATDFATGGGTPAETISNAAVSYWSGPATATSGIGIFVPGQPTAANAVTLAQQRTAFSQTLTVLGTSASWNPTIVVNTPTEAIAGTYTGTIAHSVALCRPDRKEGFDSAAVEQETTGYEEKANARQGREGAGILRMNRRSALWSVLASLATVAVVLAPRWDDRARAGTCPASTTCPTTTQFTVNAGALTIDVPDGPINLGSGAPGTTIAGTFTGSGGTVVTVSDLRASLTPDWTASVSSTDFTTGGGTAAETVTNDDVSYASGTATSTSGTGTFTPGQTTPPGSALSGSVTAFSHSGGSGNNTAAWNPTISVDVPAAAVAGTYTGTISHSVA